MISHKIVKRPETIYSNNYGSSYYNNVKRLTQEELDAHLASQVLRVGDLVYYCGAREPFTTLNNRYQLQLINDVRTKADEVTYQNYEKLPEIFQVIGIGNACDTPAWRSYSRWEHSTGLRKITKAEYDRFVDDRVQDYLKTHSYTVNIPE